MDTNFKINNGYLSSYEGNDQIVTIPEDVTFIKYHTFEYCTSLKKIIISNNVKTIEICFTSGCVNLEEIHLGRSVADLKSSVFNNIKNLAKITCDKDNPNFASDEYGALYSKDFKTLIFVPINIKLKSYRVSPKTQIIGPGAFANNNLEEVILNEGIIEIGKEAFAHSHIKDIKLPKSLKRIKAEAFSGINIPSIYLPDGVEEVGAQAFIGIKDIYLEGTIKSGFIKDSYREVENDHPFSYYGYGGSSTSTEHTPGWLATFQTVHENIPYEEYLKLRR